MSTYVSTGGVRNKKCTDVAWELLSHGVKNIELSGGLFDPMFESHIQKLVNEGAELTLHNYVPLESVSYVLNLASSDARVVEKTLSHIKKCIDLSVLAKSKKYAFHAGFLIDPKPEELGKRISNRVLQNRDDSFRQFVGLVNEVAEYANRKGIQVLVENNVISSNNMKEFGGNPLLMCDPEEISRFFELVDPSVKLLLDVAHLKVSSVSMGFDLYDGIRQLKEYVGGLHLSDNNGLSDQNAEISSDSWFLGEGLESDYKVVEVYNYDPCVINQQVYYCENEL
jgi:sugar phosphate isomerase/epimerase